ncbi:MAG: hypothetical protein QM715_05265 [Nibricoccus sp.]
MASRNITDLLNEFREWIDAIYGTYLDSVDAFPLLKAENEKEKKEIAHELLGLSDINQASERIRRSYPRLVKGGKAEREIHLHCADIDTVIKRNERGGKNTIFSAKMAVISIFGYWEDHIRKKLEQTLSSEAESVKVQAPVLGDLCLIRNMIVHNRSRADENTPRLKILHWFSENDDINPTKDQIEDLVDRLFEFSRSFETDCSPFIVKSQKQ